MDGDPPVGSQPLGQSLTDELVTEAIPRAVDHEDPGPQRDIEQGKGIVFLEPGQHGHVGGIDGPPDEGELLKQLQRTLVEVEKAGRNCIACAPDEGRDPGDGVARKLEQQVRVSLCELNDPIGYLGVPRRHRSVID